MASNRYSIVLIGRRLDKDEFHYGVRDVHGELLIQPPSWALCQLYVQLRLEGFPDMQAKIMCATDESNQKRLAAMFRTMNAS